MLHHLPAIISIAHGLLAPYIEFSVGFHSYSVGGGKQELLSGGKAGLFFYSGPASRETLPGRGGDGRESGNRRVGERRLVGVNSLKKKNNVNVKCTWDLSLCSGSCSSAPLAGHAHILCSTHRMCINRCIHGILFYLSASLLLLSPNQPGNHGSSSEAHCFIEVHILVSVPLHILLIRFRIPPAFQIEF